MVSDICCFQSLYFVTVKQYKATHKALITQKMNLKCFNIKIRHFSIFPWPIFLVSVLFFLPLQYIASVLPQALRHILLGLAYTFGSFQAPSNGYSKKQLVL
jgi:hypothetical protein